MENNNIPTARDILNRNPAQHNTGSDLKIPCYYPAAVESLMLEFAKLHVQQALKAASENVKIKLLDFDKENVQKLLKGELDIVKISEVDKDSILNSYPLDNIK